ncbi:LysR family transcriptional regulator [Mycobacteroides franklinii]|uniref:Probable hydrogen peroxide-inducible genes activator n=1 Tax=Mycobacteroides franklinii TaxID=948102 RepID=A0A4R8QXK9_9MYCO|nr:LysR family transcriptional regulator [Mycobacteroides franklinii]TDZ45132.1 HTH-type transcriptional regulator DmlR [Mycobacteroides franklinii]TDZ48622.1 HTH-type transcriptional regulator DmlR [Mycobacteroides franklinii]TDZ58803.1 HTH-type transcriptional regulator DmlR [Mycobacteroides franklinii]TDZ66318.1 HTH-type transcriptional regulator DmlR [Mycobacteroides franklinii]TDZ72241.1 HTH-type transcriptional regulator DmlR [Mycobacteroides franklinii]
MSVRSLNLDDLRCFVAVAHRLSFSQAARELHLTPSVLSRRISNAERVLSANLFVRDTRSVTLTHAGARLLPLAQEVIEKFDRMPDEISKGPLPVRKIRCGIPPWLPPVLQAKLTGFGESNTEKFKLTQAPLVSADIIDGILHERLDFGFVRPNSQATVLSYTTVWKERIGAVLSREQFASRKSIAVAELLALDYIGDRRDSDTEYRRDVETELDKHGQLKRAEFTLGDGARVKHGIAAGEAFNLAPMPSAGEPNRLEYDEFVLVPISDLSFRLLTCLAYRDDTARRDRGLQDVLDTIILMFRE